MDLKENELSFSDYAVIARLHCYHIGKGFLASLGVPFLTLLYEAIDNDNNSVLIITRDEDNIVGFVTGSNGLVSIYKRLLFKPLKLIYSLRSCFLSISKLYKILEVLLLSIGSKTSLDVPKHELLSIVVSPAYQGKGYAENLFNDLCNHFRDKGINSFSIIVGKNLDRAHAFYKKMGSIPLKEIEVHKGNNSIIYIKDLSK